jgi:hypothetical protein
LNLSSTDFEGKKKKVFGHTQEILTNLCMSSFSRAVREREREKRAEIGKKDKARKNEREGRERPEHSVTDAFTD